MLTFWRLWREYRRSGLSVRRAASRAWQTVYGAWAMDQYLASLDGSLHERDPHEPLGASEPSRARTEPRATPHGGPRIPRTTRRQEPRA